MNRTIWRTKFTFVANTRHSIFLTLPSKSRKATKIHRLSISYNILIPAVWALKLWILTSSRSSWHLKSKKERLFQENWKKKKESKSWRSKLLKSIKGWPESFLGGQMILRKQLSPSRCSSSPTISRWDLTRKIWRRRCLSLWSLCIISWKLSLATELRLPWPKGSMAREKNSKST